LIDFVNNKRLWHKKFKDEILKKNKDQEKLNPKEKRQIYSVFIAWYVQHRLVSIHPFCDGNGRMGRLIMCLILRMQGFDRLSFPILINAIIRKDKPAYLDALNKSDAGDYIFGLNYLTKVMSKAFIATSESFNRISK
jgi:Fic family protein